MKKLSTVNWPGIAYWMLTALMLLVGSLLLSHSWAEFVGWMLLALLLLVFSLATPQQIFSSQSYFRITGIQLKLIILMEMSGGMLCGIYLGSQQNLLQWPRVAVFVVAGILCGYGGVILAKRLAVSLE